MGDPSVGNRALEHLWAPLVHSRHRAVEMPGLVTWTQPLPALLGGGEISGPLATHADRVHTDTLDQENSPVTTHTQGGMGARTLAR